jgi:hypothetical protein
MGAFAISVIVAASAVTLLAIVAIAWRGSRARPASANEPNLDVLMRHALRRSPSDSLPSIERNPSVARKSLASETRPKKEKEAVDILPHHCGDQLPVAVDAPPASTTAAVRAQDAATDTSSDHEILETGSPAANKPRQAPTDVLEISPAAERDSSVLPADTVGDADTDEQVDREEAGLVPAKSDQSRDVEPEIAIGDGLAPERDTPLSSVEVDSEVTGPSAATEKSESISRPKQRAVHRDRRGRRRNAKLASLATPTETARTSVSQPPAEAWLRLALHPIQQTAVLTLVLSRPVGFPERAFVEFGGKLVEFGAYDERRYDDIDVDWRPDLLAGELRVETADGFRWVRSARRVHIFSGDPAEPDLVSVPAARLGAEHTLLSRVEDTALVEAVARATGSPELRPHDHWQGIPDGWRVFSGYIPIHAAEGISDLAFQPLDPGFDIKIELAGGIAIRRGVFTQGHPPRIEISTLPEGATVSIGGERASLNIEQGWEAPGWNAPGQHIVDVVPGPSLTYEIMADPADGVGWTAFELDDNRFPGCEPWARAQICGAVVTGPSGEQVFAHETRPTLVALGSHDHATVLHQRVGVGVSVGLLPAAAEFLVVSWGQRRHQGTIVWLGLEGASEPVRSARRSVFAWAGVVRGLASRRLPVEGTDSSLARRAWQSTVCRARNLKRWRT